MVVSHNAGGLQTTTRYIRATQLYTRLVVSSYSFVRMLPGNRLTREKGEFWDWPTVAIVARSLVEAYHVFFFLTDPSLSPEEAEFRLNLLNLHLNSEKYRLYREGGVDVAKLQDFEEGLPRQRERLSRDPVFGRLRPKTQKQVLRGRQFMHLSHADIADRLPFMGRDFKWLYRLFSNHIHCTPFSFQAQSDVRGRGAENEAERGYLILATQVAVKYLSSAVLDMGRIFPAEIGTKCAVAVAQAKRLHGDDEGEGQSPRRDA